MHLYIDYDDTLAPTERVALGSACDLTNEVLVEQGKSPLDREDFIGRFPGRSYRDILAEVANESGISLSPERSSSLIAEEVRRAIVAFQGGLSPAPGSNEALERLAGRGHRLHVVSSSMGERLHVCLAATGQDRFIPAQEVFSAQSSLPTPTPKPAPDIYTHARTVTNASVEQSLAFEDSTSGVRSSVADGIPTVAFLGLVDPCERDLHAEKLFKLGARWAVDHWDAVPGLVDLVARGRTELVDELFGPQAYTKVAPKMNAELCQVSPSGLTSSNDG